MQSNESQKLLFENSLKRPDFRKHAEYLTSLKENGFNPRVIYDIGCCVLHWTNMVKQIFPDAEIILFDALSEAEFLYSEYKHHVGVLGDKDGKVVTFYKSVEFPGGNSYYREIGHVESAKIFSESAGEVNVAMTLDTIVSQNKFPLPDLVKIDVQGAEKDIVLGGINTLKHSKHMIIEMQHVEYNKGAPRVEETLPFIESLGFKCTHHKLVNNGPDADYAFERI